MTMGFYEYMCKIEEDDNLIRNISEGGSGCGFESCDDTINDDNISEGGSGCSFEPWDEESCDNYFLGSDPYTPLY